MLKNFFMRFLRMVIGLFIYSFGIVLTIRANLGLAPWDVFHQGVTKHIPITMGQASIFVGLIIVIIFCIMREKLGLGTIFNMVLIGIFIDFFLSLKFLPDMQNFFSGLLMMIAGLFILAFASFLYIGAGFGAGPRDGLMVAVTKRTKWPVGVVRAVIEVSVLVIGYFLGGYVGIGTVISAFGVSQAVQIVFSLLKFDVKTVKQESLIDNIKFFKAYISKRNGDGDF